jgi:hypothetical protein
VLPELPEPELPACVLVVAPVAVLPALVEPVPVLPVLPELVGLPLLPARVESALVLSPLLDPAPPAPLPTGLAAEQPTKKMPAGTSAEVRMRWRLIDVPSLANGRLFCLQSGCGRYMDAG